MTRNQKIILGVLAIAVIAVFALAIYLDMQIHVDANVSDFTTTLEAIDREYQQTRDQVPLSIMQTQQARDDD